MVMWTFLWVSSWLALLGLLMHSPPGTCMNCYSQQTTKVIGDNCLSGAEHEKRWLWDLKDLFPHDFFCLICSKALPYTFIGYLEWNVSTTSKFCSFVMLIFEGENSRGDEIIEWVPRNLPMKVSKHFFSENNWIDFVWGFRWEKRCLRKSFFWSEN